MHPLHVSFSECIPATEKFLCLRVYMSRCTFAIQQSLTYVPAEVASYECPFRFYRSTSICKLQFLFCITNSNIFLSNVISEIYLLVLFPGHLSQEYFCSVPFVRDAIIYCSEAPMTGHSPVPHDCCRVDHCSGLSPSLWSVFWFFKYMFSRRKGVD